MSSNTAVPTAAGGALRASTSELLRLVYEELRKLAAQKMASNQY